MIHVVAHITDRQRNHAYLIRDNWDDWFTYTTTYGLVYVDGEGETTDIGSVKIGELGLQKGRADIPATFEQLDDQFFSLGQSETYYETLNGLGDSVRDTILTALNDIAFDNNQYEKAKNEKILHSSLLRDISIVTVKGQFRRLAHGGSKLSHYEFTYRVQQATPIDLMFRVVPESNPPTNIHAFIGRNGVGKTHLISNMIKTILSAELDDQPKKHSGTFFEGHSYTQENNDEMFASLVLVSFSAFDTSQLPKERNADTRGINYSYIGLRQTNLKTGLKLPPKSPEILSSEFADSAYLSCKLARHRWLKAIEMLETDPLFRAYDISQLTGLETAVTFKEKAIEIFDALSSGHKIVLLTMTRLVETVQERSLVLLDEPESHLHPPLLSALTRALSDLLIQRNGVAIIATHSPVILQEVPRSCVWILRSSMSRILAADRPSIETFGENIGALTREVFKLEVENSGFHKMLQEAIDEYEDYDQIINHFSGELGNEAKAIVRAMIALKE